MAAAWREVVRGDGDGGPSMVKLLGRSVLSDDMLLAACPTSGLGEADKEFRSGAMVARRGWR